MQIAIHSLAGDIAYRQGKNDEAVEHYRLALELEDALTYTEPAYWNRPIRLDLGAALMAAGRHEEAEAVYRENLARFKDNGWALHGLAAALDAQGKAAEAAEVRADIAEAWSEADIELAGSRL
jgi:tetratricopeptide (TPR) repeat protein